MLLVKPALFSLRFLNRKPSNVPFGSGISWHDGTMYSNSAQMLKVSALYRVFIVLSIAIKFSIVKHVCEYKTNSVQCFEIT